MLLGRGEERSRGARVSLSSNAVQAMLAAVYIGLKTPPGIVDALPHPAVFIDAILVKI